jgi:hypothetical protein
MGLAGRVFDEGQMTACNSTCNFTDGQAWSPSMLVAGGADDQNQYAANINTKSIFI